MRFDGASAIRHLPRTRTLSARYVSPVFATADNSDGVEGVPGIPGTFTLVDAKAGNAFSKTAKASLVPNKLLDDVFTP